MDRKNRGFIKLILSVVILIVILSLFRIDIKSIFESELVQKNLGYVWSFVVGLWDTLLKTPALWIWENIVIKLIVNPLENLGNTVD